MAGAADRAAFVRDSMRQSWGGRTRSYADHAAPNTAAHTEVLLTRVRPAPGERVLDVATGPGVVALAAAARVGPGGRVVATDLAPEWGAILAERAAAAGLVNVTFRAMGAEALDLPDASFDVAVCQFGLMFVPDPVRALREMRRVLRPGGRIGVVVWSTADRVPCLAIFQRHLAPVLPEVPPEQQLPTPLSLGDPGLIERLVAAAGFRDVAAERQTQDFIIESAEAAWRERVEEGPLNVREAVGRLGPEQRAHLRNAIATELHGYQRDGKIKLPGESICVTALK